MRVSFCLVGFSLALAACAPTTGSPDAGQPQPDPAWWGLQDNVCRHYQDDSGNPNYALEIHASDKFPGVKTYDVVERLQGLPQREWWFQVTSDSLLLRGLSDVESGSGCSPSSMPCLTYYTYDPPPVYLKNDLDQGGSAESDTQAAVSGARAGTFAEHFSSAIFPSETLTIAGKQVVATKYTLSVTEAGQPTVVDRLWLAPKLGFVKIDPDGQAIGPETFVKSEPVPSDGCS